jgi:small subunit ribosomal protein S5
MSRGQGGGGGGGGEAAREGLVDRTVQIKRCAAVVKGGRRFSFAAMVVVGDGKGRVGWGYAKANEVPPSVEKAQKQAMRSMITVPIEHGTIAHRVQGQYGAARVILLPASSGTGVIAGAAVRAVCECAGITDILTKSFGTTNQVTVVKATMAALKQIRTKADVERLRGVTLS